MSLSYCLSLLNVKSSMLQKDLSIGSKTAKLNNESSYLFWHVMKGHVASSPETGYSIIHAANWRSYKTYLGQAPFVIEAFLKSSVPLPPSCNWISMENNKFWARTLYKYTTTSGVVMFFLSTTTEIGQHREVLAWSHLFVAVTSSSY